MLNVVQSNVIENINELLIIIPKLQAESYRDAKESSRYVNV